jgi:hypothetical protein
MKKALLGLLILALVLPAVFADDALVMPAKVIRTYITGAYASISKAYDNDGKAQDLPLGIKSISVINLGAAVEYGINDWITGAVQWAPGYNVYSKFDVSAPFDKASLAGAADIFVGAKIQIVGPKAPVQNESIRFALAPGVKVPLSKPDFAKEAAKVGTDTFLMSPADKLSLGVGGRAYLDYILNEMFFFNLYSEFIYYPTAVKFVDASLLDYSTVLGLRGGYSDPTYDPSFKYGYDLTLEFEPHFSTMISDGLQLSAGVPITYSMAPALSVSGDTHAGFGGQEASNILTLGPNASLFFQKTFLPIEIKAGYTLPLLGKNSNVTDTVVLQLKAYAKF